MTKTLFITTGTNDAECETKATTEAGYVKAAAKLCGESISRGLQRVRIKVVEDGEEIYCATHDLHA